jgi:hypothetical protein
MNPSAKTIPLSHKKAIGKLTRKKSKLNNAFISNYGPCKKIFKISKNIKIIQIIILTAVLLKRLKKLFT